MNHRTVTYCLMGVLVTLWGIEYVAAKYMLGFVEPMTLQFMKSAMGTLFLLPVILRQTQQPHQIPRLSPAARLKDAGMVVLATGIGIVLYFLCEYTAMDYLPVSAITLMLGILPAMSIIVERIVYGRKISAKLLLLVFASIAGIAIVIGGDFRVLLSGRLIGYVLSFGCVMCWTVYNFITEHMGAGSTPYTLAFRQLLYTSVMLLPYFILHFPEFGSFTLTANIAMLFLGIVISGCGYIIIVRTLT